MNHDAMMRGSMMQGHMGGGGWWGLFGLLGALLVLVLIAAVVYAVVRKFRHDEALVVLRRRFAQGEIGEEEYQKRLALLK